MRHEGWVLVVSLWLAAPAATQAQPGMDFWRSFYDGCAETPGNEYLCACAATEFTERCMQAGARTPVQLAQCAQQNQQAWTLPVSQACLADRTRLHLAGPVARPRPQPIQPTSGRPMARAEVWDAAFQGCTRSTDNLYACACIATYSAEACAPRTNVPEPHVERCIREVQPAMTQQAPACTQLGALSTMQGPAGAAPPAAAPPPAAAAPPPGPAIARPRDVDANYACSGLREDAGPAAATACVQAVNAIANNNVQAFLRLVGDPVALGEQNLSPGSLRDLIQQRGGLWAFMTEGAQRFMPEGAFATDPLEQPYDTFQLHMNVSIGTGRRLYFSQRGRAWRIDTVSEPQQN